MDRRLIALLFIVFTSLGCKARIQDPHTPEALYGESPSMPSIRLLCLKHSREHMADGDADLAIKAAQNAQAKGLNIKVVGNHFVDGRLVAGQGDDDLVPRIYDAETLTKYVEQYIKTDATPGDTLILFTIGHGFPSGSLQNIGRRADVQQVIATIAEKNNQRIFWWQLSCHASAGLPGIETLPAAQQELLGMFASSSASEQSAAYVQGNIMAKVFNAMADRSPGIDPNGDGKITAGELRAFMNTINSAYGGRVHAKSADKPLFGKSGVPWLPVRDRNNPQGKYDEEYIFLPK